MLITSLPVMRIYHPELLSCQYNPSLRFRYRKIQPQRRPLTPETGKKTNPIGALPSGDKSKPFADVKGINKVAVTKILSNFDNFLSN